LVSIPLGMHRSVEKNDPTNNLHAIRYATCLLSNNTMYEVSTKCEKTTTLCMKSATECEKK
jgi:hypothetical protein